MNKLAVLGLIIALIIGVGVGFSQKDKFFPSPGKTKPSTNIRIGLSMDTLKELRWTKDRDLMTAKAAELGATVTTLVADGDDKTQISQIQNFITQKVDVIVVIAHNGKALSAVVDEANKAGIKVIAYDRMIMNSNLDMYISFDSTKVGEYAAKYVLAAVPKTVAVPLVAFIGGSETDNNASIIRNGAMKILNPLIKSGKAKLTYDQQFTKDWNPDIAYKNLKKYLDAGGKVDAVVASNDGTAFGAIQALKEHGLAGKVPVSGQDAELSAVKRLVDGTQTISCYKPIAALANQTIEAAVDFASGKTPKTNGTMNNEKIDVPSFLIDPVPVTKDTIKDTVIKDGFYTTAEVYGTSKP
jgi:D-xylose transport system substrate-binding protein